MWKIRTALLLLCLLVGATVYLAYRSNRLRTIESGAVTSPDHSLPERSTPPFTAPAPPAPAATPLATDSIPPNPPNGMIFAGKGRFQLYRQGNLTWRVNTVSGTTCILFATDAEWRKPRVYRQGCDGAYQAHGS